MLRTLFAGIVALATLVALPAAACPNWQAAPVFGQIDLYSGFTPDPYARNITAGGTQNLANCFTGGFTGFEDSHRMSFFAQIIGGTETAGTGTDDGDAAGSWIIKRQWTAPFVGFLSGFGSGGFTKDRRKSDQTMFIG